MAKKILELMEAPPSAQDPDWLKKSLQAALELELSTLPPYLCGLWSINEGSEAYDRIYSVVMEEMLHMGLACNMLTSIGGTPRIVEGYKEISYPGPLPGGVRPELTVYLAGLSHDYIKAVYLQIEYPEDGPVALELGRTYATIGAFYDEIVNVFQRLQPAMSGTHQITANVSGKQLFPIASLDHVEKAIDEIKGEGEGTSQSPLVPGSMTGELAHYYKFAEIYHERKLVQNESGKWDYVGDPVPFPTVTSILPIPLGGYHDTSSELRQKLANFNQAFTKMLTQLDAAWSGAGGIGAAVGTMDTLNDLSNEIMAFSLPDGKSAYGPEFRLV